MWREYARASKEHLSAIKALRQDGEAADAAVLVEEAQERHAKACLAIWLHQADAHSRPE